MAFLAPIKFMATIVLALVIIDLKNVVYAAFKRGEKITSAAMRKSVSKLIVYQLALLSAFLVQFLTGITSIPVVNLVASFIGFTEFFSIFENLNSISGTNLFKNLMKTLGKNVKEKIDNIDIDKPE
jgi:hypothetical protein